MLGTEGLEPGASHLPEVLVVGFHLLDDTALFDVVEAARHVHEVVDVEDCGVGG